MVEGLSEEKLPKCHGREGRRVAALHATPHLGLGLAFGEEKLH